MPTFTADTARTLGGPSWLVERRLAAAERFGAAPWPTTEEEIWRYSRIEELDLESFRSPRRSVVAVASSSSPARPATSSAR